MNILDRLANRSLVPKNGDPRYELRIGLLIIVLCGVVPFAMDGFVPSLPAMTHAFGSTANVMQLTVTLYLLGGVPSQLLCGPLSDRFGRRNLALIGMAIGLLGSLMCIFATTPAWVIGARFIQGFGIGCCNALFRAIMRDTFSAVRLAKVGSYVGIAYTVVVALAPVIGGYVQAGFDWRGNFVFLFLLLLMTTILIWLFLPETNQHRNPEATQGAVIWRNYSTLLINPIFVGYTACSTLALSGIIAYFTVSPFLLQNVVGLTPVEYGWSSILLAFGLMLGSFLNGRYVTRFGGHRMLVFGIIVMILSGVVMLVSGLLGYMNTSVILIPAFFFDIAGGFVYANAMSGALHPFAKMAGSAGAMYGALQVLGAFITTLFVAALHRDNQNLLAIIFIGLGVVAGLVFYFLILRGDEQAPATASKVIN